MQFRTHYNLTHYDLAFYYDLFIKEILHRIGKGRYGLLNDQNAKR